jgi:hypothetical protein
MKMKKKTIESFDKTFAIENALDKLVGGASLISEPVSIGDNVTGSGPLDEHGGCAIDDSAEEIIIYCPGHGRY